MAQTVKESAYSAGDVGSILGREDPMEKEIATHSSILAWRIPWTEVLGGLQSLGSQRVGHNLATKQQLEAAFMPILIGYLSYIRLFSFQSLSRALKMIKTGSGAPQPQRSQERQPRG